MQAEHGAHTIGLLASGSWDATVKVWRCNEINHGHLVNLDHDLLAQLEHENQVSAVALCPDNSQLVNGDFSEKIGLFLIFLSGHAAGFRYP